MAPVYSGGFRVRVRVVTVASLCVLWSLWRASARRRRGEADACSAAWREGAFPIEALCVMYVRTCARRASFASFAVWVCDLSL